MEHHQPEHPAAGETRTAEAVSPENHKVLSEPKEHPQDKDAKEADGAAGEQEPVDQASLPAQGQDSFESPLPDASSSQPGPARETRPETETAGACSRLQELPQSPRARQPELDFYCVKWIPWKGEQTPIITQSANGPCPLIAIANILFLQWKVRGSLDGVLGNVDHSAFLKPVKLPRFFFLYLQVEQMRSDICKTRQLSVLLLRLPLSSKWECLAILPIQSLAPVASRFCPPHLTAG